MDDTLYGESNGLLGYAEDVSDYYNPDLDGEDDAGEDYSMIPEMAEARSDRSRRARAMMLQRARARARMAKQRGLTPSRRYLPPTSTSRQPATTGLVSKGFERVGTDVQKINATVQSVDVESKLQADILGRSLKAQQERVGRAEYAVGAAIVAGVAQGLPVISGNSVLKKAVAVAPVAFLNPGKVPFHKDPRVLTVAAVAGLALFDHFQNKVEEPAEVTITTPTISLPTGKKVQIKALVRDRNRNPIPGRSLFFESLDDTIATVVDSNGFVEAKGQGKTTIIVTDTGASLSATAEVNVTR